jgi:hypothetical protein
VRVHGGCSGLTRSNAEPRDEGYGAKCLGPSESCPHRREFAAMRVSRTTRALAASAVFASFAQYLWLDHLGTRTAHESFLLDYSRKKNDPFWDTVIADPQRDTMFANAVYRRGAMTLQALREKIGDDPFFQILRTWAASTATARRRPRSSSPCRSRSRERISTRSSTAGCTPRANQPAGDVRGGDWRAEPMSSPTAGRSAGRAGLLGNWPTRPA